MYDREKPTKWGIRIYDIADALTGYILGLIPYCGKATIECLGYAGHLFTTRIILTLVDIVTHATGETGYHVYTDRLYTNLSLAAELLKKKIHMTGTKNTNRKGLPPQVKKRKRSSVGTVRSYVKNKRCHILSWKDKRDVIMCSTYHTARTTQHRRVMKGNLEQVIEKPVMVSAYTSNMGGVDRADHYISSYCFLQKSMKWWRKVYFFLLEVAIVNSFILHRIHMKSKGLKVLSHLQFRKELVKELVGNVKNAAQNGRRSTSDDENRLNGKLHIIAKQDRKHSIECIVCSDRRGPGGRKNITVKPVPGNLQCILSALKLTIQKRITKRSILNSCMNPAI
ncbi:piggyBac transposable element-derived protein 4-like [Palaemon carinicauda]|uniref:piggyBac transposable element-derived protein 4-like n=1 Tax=Palaemon carinicauda TaxID=392227 RepID=UPI0035B5800F